LLPPLEVKKSTKVADLAKTTKQARKEEINNEMRGKSLATAILSGIPSYSMRYFTHRFKMADLPVVI